MNISTLLTTFAILLFSTGDFASTTETNPPSKSNTSVAIDGDVLCVANNGYSRKSIVLWFKDEAISTISVAGNDESCFRIGDNEGAWQWKASEGMRGSKKGFYGNTATFY
ncbi:hypothetical protein OAF30_02915 [Flavobacteriales bacterium]|nr:hypothetical protein [Flavobacteriales bacterium]